MNSRSRYSKFSFGFAFTDDMKSSRKKFHNDSHITSCIATGCTTVAVRWQRHLFGPSVYTILLAAGDIARSMKHTDKRQSALT